MIIKRNEWATSNRTGCPYLNILFFKKNGLGDSLTFPEKWNDRVGPSATPYSVGPMGSSAKLSLATTPIAKNIKSKGIIKIFLK